MEMHVGTPFCFTRSRLQKEILEPFSAACGIQTLIIKGNVDENLARSMMVKMGSQWECISEILDLFETFLKRGDAAAAAGLTKAASFHYEQGSSFTFFAGQSHIDTFDVQTDHVYNSLRVAPMLNAFDVKWAKVLLKLRCYKDVQRLAYSMLSRQSRSQSNPIEAIRLMLCRALACLGLGESNIFGNDMRHLFQKSLDLKACHTGNGWTYTSHVGDVFPDEHCMVEFKNALIQDLDELVAYCKDGEAGSLRRIDTDRVFLDREQIELPIAQHWSAIATRYERRYRTWTRNKSVWSSF